MKSVCSSHIGLVALSVVLAALIFITQNGAAEPSPGKFSVQTRDFTLNFEAEAGGRLYQHPIGADDPNAKLRRDDEFYPQAGDGYVWEPALQVTHADGNTSTALLFDDVLQTNETPDVELTRIQLHDPAYPMEVTLCFRAHRQDDVIEETGIIRCDFVGKF